MAECEGWWFFLLEVANCFRRVWQPQLTFHQQQCVEVPRATLSCRHFGFLIFVLMGYSCLSLLLNSEFSNDKWCWASFHVFPVCIFFDKVFIQNFENYTFFLFFLLLSCQHFYVNFDPIPVWHIILR